jgi:hypothetical protein
MAAGSPPPLPDRPHPDWYRKAAKKKLAELRTREPRATLSIAQLEIARVYGFSSWRTLIAAVGSKKVQAGSTMLDEFFGAIRAREPVKVQAMLAAQPRLAVTRYGQLEHTPLSWAVTTEAFDVAAVLSAAGAKTDLFCAAAMGELEAARSFFDRAGKVKADASHTCRTRFGRPSTRIPRRMCNGNEVLSDALYGAARYKHVAVVRFLIDRGADVNARVFLGCTPLHWAHYGGSGEIVEMLVKAGADAGALDDTFECTPRAFAICMPARLGNVPLVVERLRDDRSLATINEGRGTPLHEAARAGNQAIVRLLLAAGADPTARDSAFRTPGDLAP